MSLPQDIEGHIGYGWDMKTQRKEETVLTCQSGDVIFRDLDSLFLTLVLHWLSIHWCWEIILGPPKDQSVLLTTEPSLDSLKKTMFIHA